MRMLVVVCALCACGKSDKADTKADPAKPSAPTTPSAPDGKPGVTGSLELTGAVTATISWKPDLAFDCMSRSEIGHAFSFTMTDGKDMFTAIDYVDVKNQPQRLDLTSGKLKSAGKHLGTISGVTATGDNDRMSATIDTTFTEGAESVTVKGKLDFVCAHL